jgi:hypothetical protein
VWAHVPPGAVADTIDGADVDNELQQLGLPIEHSQKFAQILDKTSGDMKRTFNARYPRLPTVAGVVGQWQRTGGDGITPVCNIDLTLTDGDRCRLQMSARTLDDTIRTLQQAETELNDLRNVCTK